MPSKAAKKYHGYGWVWPVVAKIRGRLPVTKEGLWELFISKELVRENIPAYVSIVRNNAIREKPGWKSVMYGRIDSHSLEIIRAARGWSGGASLSYHKPIPVIGDRPMLESRQPAWSRPQHPEFKPRVHIRLGKFANRLKEAAAQSR